MNMPPHHNNSHDQSHAFHPYSPTLSRMVVRERARQRSSEFISFEVVDTPFLDLHAEGEDEDEEEEGGSFTLPDSSPTFQGAESSSDRNSRHKSNKKTSSGSFESKSTEENEKKAAKRLALKESKELDEMEVMEMVLRDVEVTGERVHGLVEDEGTIEMGEKMDEETGAVAEEMDVDCGGVGDGATSSESTISTDVSTVKALTTTAGVVVSVTELDPSTADLFHDDMSSTGTKITDTTTTEPSTTDPTATQPPSSANLERTIDPSVFLSPHDWKSTLLSLSPEKRIPILKRVLFRKSQRPRRHGLKLPPWTLRAKKIFSKLSDTVRDEVKAIINEETAERRRIWKEERREKNKEVLERVNEERAKCEKEEEGEEGVGKGKIGSPTKVRWAETDEVVVFGGRGGVERERYVRASLAMVVEDQGMVEEEKEGQDVVVASTEVC